MQKALRVHAHIKSQGRIPPYRPDTAIKSYDHAIFKTSCTFDGQGKLEYAASCRRWQVHAVAFSLGAGEERNTTVPAGFRHPRFPKTPAKPGTSFFIRSGPLRRHPTSCWEQWHHLKLTTRSFWKVLHQYDVHTTTQKLATNRYSYSETRKCRIAVSEENRLFQISSIGWPLGRVRF